MKLRSRSEAAKAKPTPHPHPRSKRAPSADEEALASLLINEHVLEVPQVEQAMGNLYNFGLAEVLVREGALEDTKAASLLSRVTGAELVDLGAITPSPEALAAVPERIARASRLLPLDIDAERVLVAFTDPSAGAVEALSAAIGKHVIARVAPASDIKRATDSIYRATNAVDDHLAEFEAKDSLRREARVELVAVDEDAPVVQVAQMIITQALRDRASDIHLEPCGERLRVRYRIDGALHEVLSLPESIGPALVSRFKILAGMNIVERRKPQDGQITTTVEDKDVDIRVSTTAVVGGEKVVMRVLDKSRPLFRLTDLGMPDQVAERFAAQLRAPYGMVICAGPTGSGKTTTLYASLTELNTDDRNVMTIEDPVEYTFPTINQIQINEQAGITFAGGLRSILRQDPDVILVGEVRDVETARIAVQAALTGHFVLSSLHATDSVSALHRLLDMGVEGFLLTSAITAVCAQRLVRRVCTYCKQAARPTNEERAFLDTVGGDYSNFRYARGTGCNFCSQTGYLDRIGIYELLTLTDDMRLMVLERTGHEQFRKEAIAAGLSTLADQVMDLVAHGTTTIAEAMRTIFVSGG